MTLVIIEPDIDRHDDWRAAVGAPHELIIYCQERRAMGAFEVDIPDWLIFRMDAPSELGIELIHVARQSDLAPEIVVLSGSPGSVRERLRAEGIAAEVLSPTVSVGDIIAHLGISRTECYVGGSP